MAPKKGEVFVKGIDLNGERIPHVIAGQICEIAVGLPLDLDQTFLGAGAVLCDPNFPVYAIRKFRARILVNEIMTPILKGQPVNLFAFSKRTSGRISKLVSTL